MANRPNTPNITPPVNTKAVTSAAKTIPPTPTPVLRPPTAI